MRHPTCFQEIFLGRVNIIISMSVSANSPSVSRRSYSCISLESVFSAFSYLAALSVLSLGSVASIGSVGSVGSAFSLFSAGCIGSVFSVGCVGGFFRDCSQADAHDGPTILLPVAMVTGTTSLLAAHSVVTAGDKWFSRTNSAPGPSAYKVAYLLAAIGFICSVALGSRSSFLFDSGAILVAGSISLSKSALPPAPLEWDATLRAVGAMGAIFMTTGSILTGSQPVLVTTFAALFVLTSVVAWGWMARKTETNRQPLKWWWVVAAFTFFVGMLSAFVITGLVRYDEPGIGTWIASDLNTYGVGPEKRYVVINMTNSTLGTWDNLHDDDKRGAQMMFFGTDVTDDTSGTSLRVGIERKGKNRARDNLNMEFWDEEDEDVDYELYSALGNEYADYWLTWGTPGDITHARQIFAFEAEDIPYVLLEVLTELNGVHTYEGVGLLLPAYKRSMYKDVSDGRFDGKWKCDKDDGTFKDMNGPFLQHFDTPSRIPGVADNYADNHASPEQQAAGGWKLVYIKQKNIAKCNQTNQVLLNAAVQTMRDTAAAQDYENKDLQVFARTRVYEGILQDTDFPYRSQYFVWHNDTLVPGYMWDFNSVSYRSRPADEPLDLLNIYPTFGWESPIGSWRKICADQPAFIASQQAEFDAALAKADTAQSAVHELLNDPTVASAFERAGERNNLYNTLRGDALEVSYGNIYDYILKHSFAAERDFQTDRLVKRLAEVTKIVSGTASQTCSETYEYRAVTLIAFLTVMSVMTLVVLAVGCSSSCGTGKAQPERQFPKFTTKGDKSLHSVEDTSV